MLLYVPINSLSFFLSRLVLLLPTIIRAFWLAVNRISEPEDVGHAKVKTPCLCHRNWRTAVAGSLIVDNINNVNDYVPRRIRFTLAMQSC